MSPHRAEDRAVTRIALLHESLDVAGGGERVLGHVSSIAQQHGDVDLALLWGAPESDESQHASFGALKSLGFPPRLRPQTAVAHHRAMRRLRSWIAEPRADALLAFSFPIAIRAAVVADRLGIPCAWVWQQGLPLFESRFAAAKQWLSLQILRRSGVRIVCPTRIAVRELESLGIPAARLQQIPNGIDLAYFSDAGMSAPEKAAFRSKRGIPAGDLVAVCVARLDPLKDHEMLLRSVRRAADGGVRVSLVCVGGADSGDEAHVQRLRRSADALGVTDRVLWAGRQSDVRPWLAAADVAVLASRREVAPLALGEAGAAGLPLVASRVGGIPELVAHRQSGLLFVPGDVAGCAAALVELARDPGLRHRLGAAARDRVSKELDRADTDARWSEFLTSLLAGEA